MSTCPHCNGDGEEPGAPISETETATCSACHGTGSTTTQHTPGAIRAARAIQAQIGIPGTVDAIASIIDQETAAPDLLEALKAAEMVIDNAEEYIRRTVLPFDKKARRIYTEMTGQLLEAGQVARAAIAKTTATPVSANLVKELAPILEPEPLKLALRRIQIESNYEAEASSSEMGESLLLINRLSTEALK